MSLLWTRMQLDCVGLDVNRAARVSETGRHDGCREKSRVWNP